MTTALAFPPPEEAGALYPGSVMHARLTQPGHRFNYRVFCLLVDLDRLDEMSSASALLSVGRFNLLSFHPKDHGPRDGSDLGAYVREHLVQAGVAAPVTRVLLLCYPRLLGYAFNPISVYYAYGDDGALVGVIYEVRNTFGEHHTYVEPVTADMASEAGIRQERDKVFYVSPFMGMAHTYHFRLRPPGEEVSLRILETNAEGPALAATFHGHKRALTTANIAKIVLSLPFMTLKVMGGIHWEALKLWIRGIKFHSRPVPPEAISYGPAQVPARIGQEAA